MIIRKLKSIFFIFMIGLTEACTPELFDDPIPYIPFNDILINTSLPQYSSLRITNGFAEVSGGVRGIILYRRDQNTIMAYERNCSFQPNDACATVNVHPSGLFMTDPCCNSNFSFENGFPTAGIAWRPLHRYRTIFDGINLTITDELE
ncbi:MAG TPA: hypothetical protein PKC24_08820 [Cyclobacteriaceae bacterium]|nr:hypothetical protein [Cyclobacteriaceae bacterium]